MNQNLNDLDTILTLGYILHKLDVVDWFDMGEDWIELSDIYAEIRLRSVTTLD